MLAVDTGASKTMLAEIVFDRHFKIIKLSPSESTFCSDGDDLKVAGQFVADVQLGPVTVTNLRIMVADVVGDGLLDSRRLDWQEGRAAAHERGWPHRVVPTPS